MPYVPAPLCVGGRRIAKDFSSRSAAMFLMLSKGPRKNNRTKTKRHRAKLKAKNRNRRNRIYQR
ncbi:MAG: hypothetical protein L6Q76_14790 [Polyangiaceae bacterium]|nr:hypothetical protein [Polyangiaceae bacterium]